jgi:hypothetical protein
MDTTIDNALSIISNKNIPEYRRNHWIKVVKEEANGFRVAKLPLQAEILDRRLSVAVGRKA